VLALILIFAVAVDGRLSELSSDVNALGFTDTSEVSTTTLYGEISSLGDQLAQLDSRLDSIEAAMPGSTPSLLNVVDSSDVLREVRNLGLAIDDLQSQLSDICFQVGC